MKRWLPFSLLWIALVAMWLALYGTLDAAQIMLAAAVACGGVWGLRALQESPARWRRPLVVAELAWLVLFDIVRSNVAVAGIVMHPDRRGRFPGFVDIPLELRNPAGLALLACIITSTPGTAWAGFNSTSGVLTMHVLDLVDEEAWVRTIKSRYERRLREVFE